MSDFAGTIASAYAVDGSSVDLGRGVHDGALATEAVVQVPLRMMNRHGLVAGATGTGKTITLQALAEQLSAAGVPVFAADVKGDVSGLAAPGEPGGPAEKRMTELGLPFAPTGFPVEYLSLGGIGPGVPVRATVSDFGPQLLAKILRANDTQEQSLSLVFRYADEKGLPLLDLADLRTLLIFLESDEGKEELEGIGGPPGTGKTLSTTYLISRLQGRTVVILTGAALGLIGDACSIARELQPAMVVLEDVDLVAQERTGMGFGATSLLFRLLNEMDGIGEDADVIFVMTTNRADLLEPALAARPGRVDQAVAFPLPDAGARARLLALFSRGLQASLQDRDAIVAETDGVSPAFLRELVRKAALHAAQEGSPRVQDKHFREALDLLEQGGSIMRAMLGADGGAAAARLDEGDAWDEDDEGHYESGGGGIG